MTDIGKALYVMVGGMALVFTALIAILLAMVILERVFREPEVGEEAEIEETSEPADLDREKVAAIAATLAIIMGESEKRGATAKPTPRPIVGQPGSWRAFGRQEQMNSRIR